MKNAENSNLKNNENLPCPEQTKLEFVVDVKPKQTGSVHWTPPHKRLSHKHVSGATHLSKKENQNKIRIIIEKNKKKRMTKRKPSVAIADGSIIACDIETSNNGDYCVVDLKKWC